MGADPQVRTTIVTGAASGIGKACALRQARLGDRVLAWDLDADAAEEVARQIRDDGGHAVARGVDVRDTVATREAVRQAALESPPTGLVHAAGVVGTTRFSELEEDEYDRVMDINLRGTFFIAQAVAEAMGSAGVGSVVLLASVAGRKGRPLNPHYAASKAGVISFTQAAAMSFGPEVRFNALCPGIILTPMMQQIAERRHQLTGSSIDDPYPGLKDQLALKRYGEPEDVASVVEFLLGDLSRYVTGQAINVDGGWEYN